MSAQSFADLGVSRAVVSSLSGQGITQPFAIQQVVIGDVLAGRDVLAKIAHRLGQDARVRRPVGRPGQSRRPPAGGP